MWLRANWNKLDFKLSMQNGNECELVKYVVILNVGLCVGLFVLNGRKG